MTAPPLSLTPLLEMRGIGKEYRGVAALKDIDFDLRRGEVHAILGENGAGKSTLVKILSGAIAPTGGEIRLDGQRIQIAGPGRRAAIRDRDGLPGDEPRPDADGRAKSLSGRREVLQPSAGNLYRRAATASVAEFSSRSDGDRPVARHREAADGRNRARGPSRSQNHYLRRADRHFDSGGEAPSLRPDRSAAPAAGFGHLHQPCAGGSARDLRPDHHFAGRRAHHHRRRRHVLSRVDHPPHGRAIADR